MTEIPSFDIRYSAVNCFMNLELLNDYEYEPKLYSLPEAYPFLKQKKSIPSSAVRRDGKGQFQIEQKPLNLELIVNGYSLLEKD